MTGDNIASVVKLLEEVAFEMKANVDKCHLLSSTNNDLTVKISEV